jgi:hypothetical protein
MASISAISRLAIRPLSILNLASCAAELLGEFGAPLPDGG